MFRFVFVYPVALCFLWALGSSSARSQDDGRLALLTRLVQDESPQVRVEALRALAKIPTAESAAAALGVLEKPMDPTLDYALWLTINDLAEPWITAVQSGAWKPEGRERQLEFALKALRPDQTSRVLGTVLGDRPLSRDGGGPWIEVIGAAGGPRDLRRLLDQARNGGFDTAATVRALKALREAARLRNQRPSGDLSGLAGFLRSAEAPIRLEAVRLAGPWKEIGNALPVLIDDLAANAAASAEERTAVFESLRQIGGDEVVRGLRGLTAADRDPGVRRSASATLAALDGTVGFPAVVAAAGTLGDEAQALSFWRTVLSIKGASQPLREAIADQRLPEPVARAGMRAAREGGRDDIELVAAFAKAGGLEADSQQLTTELIKELALKASAEGDPRRGEQVFRRTELACVTCHAIGGAGGKVGPDLTSLGASAPMDYLVESMLLPNAKIKEGYAAVIVETRDGEEVTGTLARETQQEVILRNAAGQEVALPKRNIARREMGRLSLMPSGLMEPLTEGERLDLFAFLSRLGKPGEFDASRGGVARLWRIANVIHTDLQDNEGDWFWNRPFEDKRWTPVYTLVSGNLPRGLLEESSKTQPWTSKVAVILATEVDLAAPGTVRFRSSAPEGELWVAGKNLGVGREVAAALPAGRHRVVVRFDPRRLPETLRLEADGAAIALN